MKSLALKSLITKLIFLAGTLMILFILKNPGNTYLAYYISGVSVIYLLLGWYLFKGYYPAGPFFLLFIIGYLYASIFISLAFHLARWPLFESMRVFPPVWCLILTGTVLFFRKKLPPESFIQLLIESSILLILTIIVNFKLI